MQIMPLFRIFLEYSCARVDAVFLPRVGQKSHITGSFLDCSTSVVREMLILVDGSGSIVPEALP